MYNWRKMNSAQREDLLRTRKVSRLPWHSPPHRPGVGTQFHITAACYEHKPVIGKSSSRMAEFEANLLDLLHSQGNVKIYSWVILPNHYHLLLKENGITELLKAVGKFHGKSSYQWNGEDISRGRKVWCNVLENAINGSSTDEILPKAINPSK